MYTIIILFIGVVLIIGIFCVTVVCRDIVLEERDRRKKTAPEKATENKTPDVQPMKETSAQAVSIVLNAERAQSEIAAADEPVAVAEDEPTVAEDERKDPNAVVFERATETLEEKYLALTPEQKQYYDDIVKKAASFEGSKRFKNNVYEEYKIGKNSLVRLKIKRGVTVCELTIYNLEFKNYVSDNKVAAKQAPVVIKVTDAVAFSAVVDGIDIAADAIEWEKENKRKQLNLRRKQRREEEKAKTADISKAEAE